MKTFREEINLTELAKRITDLVDYYDLVDAYDTEEKAIAETTKDLVNNPLALIEWLVSYAEELSDELFATSCVNIEIQKTTT